jgi:hydroxypyruvate isomerase
MTTVSRRNLLKTVASGATMASIPSAAWPQQPTPIKRKGNIRQSVSRWCYKDIALDKLCAASAEMGCQAIDLLNPEEWDVPAKRTAATSRAR